MPKVSVKLADEFLASKRIALIGLSRDPKKFSRIAYQELTSKGFEIYPVNPLMDHIDEKPCFPDVESIPEGIDRALIMTPPKETAAVVEKAISRGMNFLWLQQGSESPEALALAEQHHINVVSKACVMMFAHPVKSVHGFHRFMARLFGQVGA